MNSIYKIEAYSESTAVMIESFIKSMNGKCIVQGRAVVTDFDFDSNHSLKLLPFVSCISDAVTDFDISSWKGML